MIDRDTVGQAAAMADKSASRNSSQLRSTMKTASDAYRFKFPQGMENAPANKSEAGQLSTEHAKIGEIPNLSKVEAVHSNFVVGEISNLLQLQFRDTQNGGNRLDNVLNSGALNLTREMFDRLTQPKRNKKGEATGVLEPNFDAIVELVQQHKDFVADWVAEKADLMNAALGIAQEMYPQQSTVEDELTRQRGIAIDHVPLLRFGTREWGQVPVLAIAQRSLAGRNINLDDRGWLRTWAVDTMGPYLRHNTSTYAGRPIPNRPWWWAARGGKMGISGGGIAAAGTAAFLATGGNPAAAAIGMGVAAVVEGGVAGFRHINKRGVQQVPHYSPASLELIKNNEGYKVIARELLQINVDDLEDDNGTIRVKQTPNRSVMTPVSFRTLQEYARGADFARYTYLKEELGIPPDNINNSTMARLSQGLPPERNREGTPGAKRIWGEWKPNLSILSQPLTSHQERDRRGNLILVDRDPIALGLFVDQHGNSVPAPTNRPATIGLQPVETQYTYRRIRGNYQWDVDNNMLLIERNADGTPRLRDEPVPNPFYNPEPAAQDRRGNLERYMKAVHTNLELEWGQIVDAETAQDSIEQRLKKAKEFSERNKELSQIARQEKAKKIEAEKTKIDLRRKAVLDDVVPMNTYLEKADQMRVTHRQQERELAKAQRDLQDLVTSIVDISVNKPGSGVPSTTSIEAIDAIDNVLNNVTIQVRDLAGNLVDQKPEVRIGTKIIQSIRDQRAAASEIRKDEMDHNLHPDLRQGQYEQDVSYQVRIKGRLEHIEAAYKDRVDASTEEVRSLEATKTEIKRLQDLVNQQSGKQIDVSDDFKEATEKAAQVVKEMVAASTQLKDWSITGANDLSPSAIQGLSVEQILERINAVNALDPTKGWDKKENSSPARQDLVVNALLEARSHANVRTSPDFVALTETGVDVMQGTAVIGRLKLTEDEVIRRGAAAIAAEIGDPSWTEAKIQAVINNVVNPGIRERVKARDAYSRALLAASQQEDNRLVEYNKDVKDERQELYDKAVNPEQIAKIRQEFAKDKYKRGHKNSYDATADPKTVPPAMRNGLTYYSKGGRINPTTRSDEMEPSVTFSQAEIAADLPPAVIRIYQLVFEHHLKGTEEEKKEAFRVAQEILPYQVYTEELIKFMRLPKNAILATDDKGRLRQALRELDNRIRNGDITRDKFAGFIWDQLLGGYLYDKAAHNAVA